MSGCKYVCELLNDTFTMYLWKTKTNVALGAILGTDGRYSLVFNKSSGGFRWVKQKGFV